MDQHELTTLGITPELASRFCALYGTEHTPPEALQDDTQETGYHTKELNVYYAMKVAMAMPDETLNFRDVKKRVTGTTKVLLEIYNDLLKKLPEAEFKASESEGLSIEEKLKRELVAKERKVFEITLREEQEQHALELVAMEEAHAKALSELNAKLSEAHGENTKMQEINDRLKAEIDRLVAKDKQDTVNQIMLDNLEAVAQERLDTINDLRDTIAKKDKAYQHERNAAAQDKEDLREERDQADNRTQKVKTERDDARMAMASYRDEIEGLRLQVAELNSRLQQKDLALAHHTDTGKLVGDIESALTPLGKLTEISKYLAKAAEQKAVDMTTVTRSMDEVTTQLLNLQKKVEQLPVRQDEKTKGM